MDLGKLTALQLAEKIKQHQISVLDGVKYVFDQIEAKEDKVHAYLDTYKKEAYARAKKVQKGIEDGTYTGPLAGVPVAIKDNICIKGKTTTCASKILENFVPQYNAEVIDRLEQAGLVITGKTNMDEFAMGSTTETSAYGVTRNPWDLEHVPGGSSGGSCAAVAAGETYLALGSDTGGSIRQPSSYCGVTGIKPTYGTVSRYGLVAYASSLDQIGPVGKDVADCAALLEIIAGHDAKDSTSMKREDLDFSASMTDKIVGMKFGVPKEYLSEGLNPEVKEAFMNTLKDLTEMGAVVEFFSMKTTEYMIPAYYIIASAEASSNLERFDGVKYGFRAKEYEGLHDMYKKTRTEGFGEEVKRRIMLGSFVLSSGYYDAYYLKALRTKALIKKEFDQAFSKYDVLLAPASPFTAPKLGESLKDPLAMYLGDIYTVAVNLCGLPGITVPCGKDAAGLPIGIQMIGDCFKENNLFRAAHAYEKKRGDFGTAMEGGKKGMKQYETVIGLEVHVELATKTKIFCGCSTEFGGAPNTHTCPVCTGMPGSLPVLNKKVVEFAIKAGLAANCHIHQYCKFDRKNYFYPDNPQNYQISQLYLPICYDGAVEIETSAGKKTVRIHEMHMEEDAGKLIHDEWEDCSLVDYNRSGVPLIEIVSEPDMRSSEEVIAYLEKLRCTMQYLGVSDCKLQEGSMRADVNLSVREVGSETFGTRTEMKNLNSFKAIARAIEGERERQIELLEEGRAVVQETRRWDDNKESSHAMRSKEDAKDYRYFPDPDLPPIHISDAWIEELRTSIPELREAKMERYQKEYELPAYDAGILTESRHLAGLFEETAVLLGNPKKVANWFMVEVLRLTKDKGLDLEKVSFTPKHLADLLSMVEKKEVSAQNAKKVFEKVFDEDIDPVVYIEENGLKIVEDTGLLTETVKKIVDANPGPLAELLGGKDKVMGFFVGQLMRELKGKANPDSVRKALAEEIERRR